MTEKLSNEELSRRFQNLEENLKVIRSRMEEAAVKSGRNPGDITLLAATKTVPAEVINRGIELGIAHIGENRVQELCGKLDALLPCDRQFIGHLQKNKIKYLIGRVGMIQSVDSEKLAQEVSRLSVSHGTETDVLIEVNIGGEENKSGVAPEHLSELAEEISALPAVHVRGLMAIPPVCEKPEEAMPYFSKMKEYFIDMKDKKMDNVSMDCLSMGMSADYVQAILCGATMVRIGSALFGPRIYR